MSGDAVVAYPLFQNEIGGSIPTSPLQLTVYEIPSQRAKDLNKKWHSRLPNYGSGYLDSTTNFGAMYDGKYYAVAIWGWPTSPSLPQDKTWFELKRLAICHEAPKYTASRMIRIMEILLKKKYPIIKKLISYQDVTVHNGIIYKASGWVMGNYHKGARMVKTQVRGTNSDNSNKTSFSPKIRWEKDIKR